VDWSNLPEDEIINEDSLLSESDKFSKRPAADCGSGKTSKKACKNCTCGRAEMEEQENGAAIPKLTREMLENPGANSSCGSCSLGDAFRCAGCPYKGLPAFTPGQPIQLTGSFLVDDLDL